MKPFTKLVSIVACVSALTSASPTFGQDGRGWHIDRGSIGQLCSPNAVGLNTTCPKFYDVDQVDTKFSNASTSWITPLRATTADHARRIQILERNLDAALEQIRLHNAQILELQSDLETAVTQLRQTQSTVSSHRDDFNAHQHDDNGDVFIP